MNINPLNIITLPKVTQNNVSFYGAKNLNFTSRDIFTKETDELSTLEKVEILHKLQLAPEKRQEVILQNDRYIDTFITAMKYGANSDVAKTFAQYSRKDLREANRLLDDEAEINNIPDIIKLKGREKQKAHILAKKKFDTLYTSTIAQQKDMVFIRTLELMKLGVCDGYILKIASLDEQNYQKVKEYLKLGLEDYQAFQLIRENKYYAQMLEKLVKEGVPYCNASACLGSDVFEKLTKRGYSKPMCAILTISNSPNMPDERKIELTQSLTSQIEKNSIKTKKFVEEMTSLIQGIKDDEFEDFVEYVSKIDFKSIKQLAPHMIRYSSEEIIDFIQWHYRNKTKEFNENTLNIEGGLSKYLSNNSLNSKQLNELLTAHPLTRREVGEIPKTWLNRRKDKNKATKEVYDAIKTFQGNKDAWSFSQELSKILKKKAEVKKIGQGSYGLAYKISIKGEEPVCLKIFYTNNGTHNPFHGSFVEVQAGLFLNNHSKEFVEMIFGKVAGKYNKDGFLVTQFLSEEIEPHEPKTPQGGYRISYSDIKENNFIHGKIIDYGGVTISSI